MRSLLEVSADGAASLDAAFRSGADALIIDLRTETGESTPVTRALALDFVRTAQFEAHRPLLYIRLPAIEAATIEDDLSGLVLGEPDGFILGRCRSSRDVQHLGAKLAVHEADVGLSEGEISIIGEGGADTLSFFGLGTYTDASARLVALAWHAGDFVADLGGELRRNADLSHAGPAATARSMTLIGARAAGIAAIDGPCHDLALDDFRTECLAARRDGFNAKVAVSLDHVATINEIFDRAL